MATEYPGNAIPVPGYRVGNFSVDDELMSSMQGYTQKGVTLKGGQGVLKLGTILARETSTKLWVKYANGGSGGFEVARGLLRQTVDTGSDTAVNFQNNIVLFGMVKYTKVSEANSSADITAAVTALKARTDTVLDTFTF